MKTLEQRIKRLEEQVGIKKMIEEVQATPRKILQKLPKLSSLSNERNYMKVHGFNDKRAETYNIKEVISVASEYYIWLLKEIKIAKNYLGQFSKESILDTLGYIHTVRGYTMKFRYSLKDSKEDLIKWLISEISYFDNNAVQTYFKSWWNLEWNPSIECFE